MFDYFILECIFELCLFFVAFPLARLDLPLQKIEFLGRTRVFSESFMIYSQSPLIVAFL